MNINSLAANSQIYSGQGSQAKSSFAQAKTSYTQAGNDKITISPEAKIMNEATENFSLSSFLSEKFMDGAGKDGVITVEEIIAFGEKYQEKADQVLDETLKELGIPSNKKITIRTDTEGTVRVNADLPEETVKKLEQALNDHPDFQQHYTKAASSFSMSKAIERHLEFAEAYEKDPQAAVARYGMGKQAPDFVLEYFNGDTKMVQVNSFSA